MEHWRAARLKALERCLVDSEDADRGMTGEWEKMLKVSGQAWHGDWAISGWQGGEREV